MSLATNVQNLATRVATEIKSVRTLVNGNAANLNALTTTDKTNLVNALNEVKASIGTSGAQINDVTASTTTVYSSSKTVSAIDAAIAALVAASPALLDTLDELAAALGDDPNFATTMSTALSNRVRVDAAQTFTALQQTQGRTNIDAASATNVGDTATNFVTTFEAGLV